MKGQPGRRGRIDESRIVDRLVELPDVAIAALTVKEKRLKGECFQAWGEDGWSRSRQVGRRRGAYISDETRLPAKQQPTVATAIEGKLVRWSSCKGEDDAGRLHYCQYELRRSRRGTEERASGGEQERGGGRLENEVAAVTRGQEQRQTRVK
jgi:hypothetical protein